MHIAWPPEYPSIYDKKAMQPLWDALIENYKQNSPLINVNYNRYYIPKNTNEIILINKVGKSLNYSFNSAHSIWHTLLNSIDSLSDVYVYCLIKTDGNSLTVYKKIDIINNNLMADSVSNFIKFMIYARAR